MHLFPVVSLHLHSESLRRPLRQGWHVENFVTGHLKRRPYKGRRLINLSFSRFSLSKLPNSQICILITKKIHNTYIIHVPSQNWRILQIPQICVPKLKCLDILSVDIICSKKQTVFWNWSSRKTVSFNKLMSKEKISEHIFLKSQMEDILCLYYASNNTHRIFPVLAGAKIAWGIYQADQLLLCMSKNISWIIMHNITN